MSRRDIKETAVIDKTSELTSAPRFREWYAGWELCNLEWDDNFAVRSVYVKDVGISGGYVPCRYPKMSTFGFDNYSKCTPNLCPTLFCKLVPPLSDGVHGVKCNSLSTSLGHH